MQRVITKVGIKRLSNFFAASSMLALILLVFCSSLQAQQMTGDVSGTVYDASGVVVSGAKVTILNVGTNVTRTDTSNERGDYSFNLLEIGHYSLRVEATGFKNYEVQDFEVGLGGHQLNAKLQVGGAKETVQVTAEAAEMQTEASSVGGSLNQKTIQDLPVSGRNFMQMVQLTAGVQGSTTNSNNSYVAGGRADDRRTGDAISANGKSDQLNNHEVDGFDNNDRAEGNIGLRPSIDGIQEVKVDTSSYNAEFGRTAGAIINVITNSGTNKLHGSAYEYLRNDMFDSWDYFAKHGGGTKKPELRLNMFGGSLGGPIRKDKTFFFADFEEDRRVEGLTYATQTPTLFEEQNPGNFSDIMVCPPGPPGPCDPSQMAPGPVFTPTSQIALNYFKLFPAPNTVPTGTNPDNYINSPNKIQNQTTVDGRVDHQFTSNDLFFARYAYNPVHTLYPGPFPTDTATGLNPNGNLQSAPGIADATAQQVQLTYTHIFNSNLIGELKAGYSRINIQSVPLNYGKGADGKLGFPAGTYAIPGLPETDAMTSANLGNSSDSAYLGDAPSEPLHNKSNNFQYLGTLNYNQGPHNFKFGAGLIHRQIQFIQTGFPAGMFIFNPNTFVNLLQDSPFLVIRMVQLVKPLYKTSEPSFYAMDNWRVSPTLTLNLGLRYEIFTPYTEAHNQYSNFDLNTLNFITGSQSNTIGVKTDYKNFSPRIGFAKSFPHQTTVVRGAFGITYFPADVGNVAGGPNLVQMANPPNFFNFFSNPGGNCVTFEGPATPGEQCTSPGPPGRTVVGLPVPSQVPLDTALNNPQVTGVYAKGLNLRSSYLEQWNLSMQHEFGANVVTLAYVGDLGRQLLRQVNADSPNPSGSATIPDYVYSPAQVGPYITGITHFYNGASESYHALQVVFNRRPTKGLAVGANYVYAHGLTNDTFGRTNRTAGILTNDPSYDYGNSDLDVRHRITFHATYNLPFAASAHGFTAVVAKGWQANAVGYWQSGMPITIVSQAGQGPQRLAYINLPGLNIDRPNSTGHTSLSNPSANQWFNVDAFSPQAIGTPGNEGVNQIVGPRDRRLDLSLTKRFNLGERVWLQFRAECFNVTNTENFSAPNPTITGWVNNSAGQTVPDLSTGFGSITSTAFSENPRQFQFGLKLLF